ISYNWDILLENQLEFAQWRVLPEKRRKLRVPDTNSPYFHIGRSYGFQTIEVRPDGRTHLAERGAQSTDIHVFKLHGAVNWRCRRAPGVPVNSNDVLVLRCHDDILKSEAARYAVDSEFESAPFIVPPVLDKA